MGHFALNKYFGWILQCLHCGIHLFLLEIAVALSYDYGITENNM